MGSRDGIKVKVIGERSYLKIGRFGVLDELFTWMLKSFKMVV